MVDDAIVVDSSALLAVLLAEDDGEDYARALTRPSRRVMGALNHLEVSIVIDCRKGATGVAELDALLQRLRVEVMPMTAEHALRARDAYRRFGKGRHPAKLNLGDCCAYALAQALSLPLLFKGNDFSQTDVQVARTGAE